MLALVFHQAFSAGCPSLHARTWESTIANLCSRISPLYTLKGELEIHWPVKVNANWRMTFTFQGEDAVLVDYQDYH
jgi:plasmid maintenance system killer protein